ncbi:MAG: DUF982 domain-containing protein [Mesorhizobium sp.]|nr:DUF982 domain-containing protein [Mesorhizobium sp.]RWJ04896.1 MAG: DUF982 domain-containing protein [Mesorhizobium sp.]RWJ11974.1 MAG: DUF982 domain-containing protein [Mesorhizobium sp.]
MGRLQFFAPVRIRMDGTIREIASVEDALAFLNKWPASRRGPVFGCALNSCNAATAGQVKVEHARQAFTSFARITGILVTLRPLTDSASTAEAGATRN